MLKNRQVPVEVRHLTRFFLKGDRLVDRRHALGEHWQKLLRDSGTKGFFAPRKGRSGPVLTPEVLSQIQAGLDKGREVAEMARELKVRGDTVNKAIAAGRLKKRF
jgi:hypothetical protein